MDRTQDSWQAALNHVKVYQGVVEVHPADGKEAPSEFMCVVQMLSLATDGQMVLALPKDPAGREALRAAEELWVTVVDGRHRWIGRCPVQEVLDKDEDSTRHRVRLERARQIVSGQRRDYYRLDTSDLDVTPVELVPADVPEPEQRLAGRMLNISGSGLGVAVSQDDPQVGQLRQGPRFTCQFQLPGMSEGVSAPARLMHVKAMPDRWIYLGLHFTDSAEVDLERVQDQIVRNITHLEREKLRRKAR